MEPIPYGEIPCLVLMRGEVGDLFYLNLIQMTLLTPRRSLSGSEEWMGLEGSGGGGTGGAERRGTSWYTK